MELVCDLIRRTFVPVVLVICSEEAEKLCARNNRTLVELLDCVPFPPLQVSIKAANDKVYQPRDFQFRFVELSHYSKSREVIAQELFDIVADRSAADLDHYGEGSFYKIRDRTDVPFFIKAGKGQEPTPWFINYRKHFLNSIGFHDHHEYFDYPIACVFAISSAEADHTNTFLKLYSPQGAPLLFQGGFSDPNISKFHLLLHDSRDFSTSQAETAISNLRTTFGKDCHLLKLNSLPDAQRNEDGTLLAQQDWAELQQWVSTLTIKTVAPHLQGVMQRLEEQLSQTRKGIGFQVSSLLNIKFGRSKAKTASPPTRHGTSSGSAETEQDVINKTVRQLADLQFMCGMYDLAKENYRLLGIEYKSLKDPLAQRSYAGVLEMTALCIQMQHTTTARQVESNLEQAFLGYQRSNIAGPYMVRCALFLVETLKSKQAFYDASLTLKRCCVALHYALSWAQQQVSSYNSNNTYLCTALLEEQAAFCHLYTHPPGFRRFAYHLVTAAEHFAAVQQLKHAVRCCDTAYGVYEERGWSLIEDTLHFKLGRYQFLLGDVEDSLTFMKRLLQHSNQPAHIQNSYLREFLHIYQEALERRRLQEQFLMAAKQTTTSAPTTSQQSDATILSSSSSSHAGPSTTGQSHLAASDLPVPYINSNSIRVYLTNFDSANQPLQTREWQAMTEDLLFGSDLKARKKALAAAGSASLDSQLISVVEEYIYVEVEVRNPLQVPIQFTQLQLVCEHELPSTPSAQPSDEESGAEVAFEVEPFDLVLRPGEKKKLLLPVVALKRGTLHIKGIGFYLCGLVWGQQYFKLPRSWRNIAMAATQTTSGPSPTENSGAATAESSASSADGESYQLSIRVTRPMPLLQVSFAHFPNYMLQGELRRLDLTISNKGQMPLQNAKVKLSHPHFFVLGTPNDSVVSGSTASSSASTATSQADGNGSLPLLPFGDVWTTGKTKKGEEEQEEDGFTSTESQLHPNPSLKYKLSTPGRNEGSDGSINGPSIVGQLADPSIIELPYLQGLAPGATVTVPVWVRGAVTGGHAFRFLFYYEPTKENPEMKYRLAKVSETFQVKPSLQLTSFVKESVADVNSYVLGLDLANVNDGTACFFRCLQISLISAYWTFTPLTYQEDALTQSLTTQRDSSQEDSRVMQDMTIGPKQTTTLLFRLLPSTLPKPDSDETVLVHTNLCLNTQGVDSTATPYSDFLKGEWQTARYEHRRAEQTVDPWGTPAEQDISPVSPRGSVSTEFKSGGNTVKPQYVDMVVFWQTSNGQHIGQQNVLSVPFVAQPRLAPLCHVPTLRSAHLLQNSLFKSIDRKRSEPPLSALLRFSMQAPTYVAHDFENFGICVVEVSVSVKNMSIHRTLRPTLESLEPGEDAFSSAHHHHHQQPPQHFFAQQTAAFVRPGKQPPSRAYFWQGAATQTLENLAPAAEACFTLCVCFPSAATYCLNRWRLSLSLPEAPLQTIYFHPCAPPLITVSQASSS